MKVETLDRQLKRKKTRPGRLQRLVLGLMSLLLIGCTGLTLITVLLYNAQYSRYRTLGLQGLQHLHSAVTLLETLPQHAFSNSVVLQAQREFLSADMVFLNMQLNLRQMPDPSLNVPLYTPRLANALRLVSAAQNASHAGFIGCNIFDFLLTRLQHPLDAAAQGINQADVNALDQQFSQLQSALSMALSQASKLHLDDLGLDPHLVQLFTEAQRQAPLLQSYLDDLASALPAFPALLGIGKPTTFLLEVLDSTELRPGGGFIGNYGLVTLSSGRLAEARIRDVDLLDVPFRVSHHFIPYPPTYRWFPQYLGYPTWSLRDSNLDADFPTVARYAEQNFALEGHAVGGYVPVSGVIAITPWFIQNVLTLLGPIPVPEYHEVISAQNLVPRIHYYQLNPAGHGSDSIPSPDGHSSQRKRFTEILAEHVMTRLHALPASSFPSLFKLLKNTLLSKDLQLYFDNPPAERLLQDLHLSDSILAPQQGDSLFVVDANISPNKANSFMLNSLDDQVTFDAAGNATHVTTLLYSWLLPGVNYGSPLYRDYLRLFVPPGSVLQSQQGWQFFGTSQAFGHTVWTGLFTLRFGQTHTLTFTWKTPHAALHEADGQWHYSYLLQHQAGMRWKNWRVRLLLPPGAVLHTSGGGLAISNRQNAIFSAPLQHDTTLNATYSCGIGELLGEQCL